MTDWTDTVIGDIASVKGGKRLPKGHRVQNSPTQHRYVRVVDLRDDGGVAIDSVRFITEEAHAATSRYIVRTNDVVISIAGTIGRIALVPESLDGANLTENAAKLTDIGEIADPGFLAAWLQSDSGQAEISARTVGTSQPKLALFRIAEIPLRLPPINSQQRVSAVLSAFDDLIANNTRRIQILEDMARTIYREWFVEFKYPGHEGVPLVESELGPIPEGWTTSTLIDLAELLVDGDWVETKDQGGDDYRLLQVSNIGVGEFRETGNYRYVTQETFARLRCTEVLVGDILISRMPKPIGRAWLVDHLPHRAITAVDVAIMRPESRASGLLVECFLNSESTLAYGATVASGTTRPRVTRRVLEQYPVCKPPGGLMARFAEIVDPMRRMQSLLQQENVALRTSRDLLLPKLVSGEIEVSDLDLEMA